MTLATPPAPAYRGRPRSKPRKGTRTVTVGRQMVAFKYATTDDGEYLLVPVGLARVVKVTR